jgi:plasmid maintenance system killer protein
MGAMIQRFRHKGLEQLFPAGTTADIQAQYAA